MVVKTPQNIKSFIKAWFVGHLILFQSILICLLKTRPQKVKTLIDWTNWLRCDLQLTSLIGLPWTRSAFKTPQFDVHKKRESSQPNTRLIGQISISSTLKVVRIFYNFMSMIFWICHAKSYSKWQILLKCEKMKCMHEHIKCKLIWLNRMIFN